MTESERILALERELGELRQENARLTRLLKLTKDEAEPAKGSQTAWFDQAPGSVSIESSPDAKLAFFGALFGARRDVYAVRWENTRSGKAGWMPAVAGGWRKGARPEDQRYLPLTAEVLTAHLTGDHHIGLYPLLPGDRTCWLAADFDGQAAMLDALAYLKAARAIGAPAALEISRSGVGAHVWVFFTEPVPAALARQLGTGLVREAIAMRGRMDLGSYDRLFPSQDTLPVGGIGNLIAAPLHGKCRRDGTTVFLDLATLEPHEDQWDYLSTLERLTPRQVAKLAAGLRAADVRHHGAGAFTAQAQTRTQPRPAPVLHVTLDGGIHLRGDDLSPSLIRDVQARRLDLESRVLRPATSPSVHMERPALHPVLRRDAGWSPGPATRACSTSSPDSPARRAARSTSRTSGPSGRATTSDSTPSSALPSAPPFASPPLRPGTARRSARVGQDRDGVLRHRGPEDIDPGARRPQDARRSVASADSGSARHQARAARRRKEQAHRDRRCRHSSDAGQARQPR